MWNLLRIAWPALARDAAEDGLREELDRSRQVQQDISRMMTQIAETGRQNTAEYASVMNAYQELSQLITRVARELREEEARQAQEARADLDSGQDFSGIAPLKSTLGIAGRRGVVSQGDEVRNLQRFLAAAGFPVRESGRFDGGTRAAVQKFQGKYSLHADGQVGLETRRLINEMIGRG